MQKNCQSCGNAFEADQEWKTICKACYARSKRPALVASQPKDALNTVRNDCQRCHTLFENSRLKLHCPDCELKVNGRRDVVVQPAQLKHVPVDRETSIVRQVCLKVASEQVKSSPEVVVEYAKRLERAFQDW